MGSVGRSGAGIVDQCHGNFEACLNLLEVCDGSVAARRTANQGNLSRLSVRWRDAVEKGSGVGESSELLSAYSSIKLVGPTIWVIASVDIARAVGNEHLSPAKEWILRLVIIEDTCRRGCITRLQFF